MQKLLNDPAQSVLDYLRGFALAHSSQVTLVESPAYLARKDAPVSGKVTIISGSGSGHEPLNAGYVGRGMLDAACPGAIFTSPTPNQYLAAVEATHGGKGVVLVVKNYAGGVLNTEVVVELLAEKGVPVETVLVRDDVAVPEQARRRGMGAAVLVEKIAGAAAEAGESLKVVAETGRRASSRCASMGVALSGCTSPTVGYPTIQVPTGEMEMGVGIHGEAGRMRVPLETADRIVEYLLPPIVEELGIGAGDEVLAMVTGLGGTPQQELYGFYLQVRQALEGRGIVVRRSLVGNYVTSLDMAGAAITLMHLDDALLQLWDAPVHTAEFHW